MKEHPILFSGEMVRAILDGHKAQTRRVIVPQPNHIQQLRDGRFEVSSDGGFDRDVQYITPPFGGPGDPGDRLWVRETHYMYGKYVLTGEITKSGRAKRTFVYKTDVTPRYFDNPPGIQHDSLSIGWHKRPSIFMPRWASRITLEVLNVRIERVQDISEEDAIAEGIEILGYQRYRDYRTKMDHLRSPIGSFRTLWNSINAGRGFGWDTNPFVWVVEFRRMNDGR